VSGSELKPVVEVRDLRVRFDTSDGETVKAIDGVDFSVTRAETFGVIGESGSGKSTLGRAIVCLLRPNEGRVLHDGTDAFALSNRELRKHRRDFQIIFQDPHSALNPRMTILDSVCEPLDIIGEGSHADRRRQGLAALDRVGIGNDFAERYPHQLSGGQKQRVNIARTLILRPKLIVCDEIVAALDVSIQADILNLLASLQRELGLTYVFVTHDLSVVSHVSDRVAVMYLGVFVEMGPADEISKRPKHPYTEALLSAEPSTLPSKMRTRKRIILEGEIPSPVSPPSGCRFRTRCRFAKEVCAAERPAFRMIEPDRYVACHFADELRLQGKDEAAPVAERSEAAATSNDWKRLA
jgi:peptide/nickel transport system ATP-binding protein/oligopeptide transport system ATP-binding protein